jgi:hypothetical protein
MEIKDKRLIKRMDLDCQAKSNKELIKIIPDSKEKMEEFELVHEPINLLNKIKGNVRTKPEAPFALKENDED